MAKKIDIRLDHGGMASMLKGAELRAELRRKAEAIALRAQELAPVDTGAYRDSIHVEDDTTDRARALVVASDWKAHIIEAASRPLGRALDAGRG